MSDADLVVLLADRWLDVVPREAGSPVAIVVQGGRIVAVDRLSSPRAHGLSSLAT